MRDPKEIADAIHESVGSSEDVRLIDVSGIGSAVGHIADLAVESAAALRALADENEKLRTIQTRAHQLGLLTEENLDAAVIAWADLRAALRDTETP